MLLFLQHEDYILSIIKVLLSLYLTAYSIPSFALPSRLECFLQQTIKITSISVSTVNLVQPFILRLIENDKYIWKDVHNELLMSTAWNKDKTVLTLVNSSASSNTYISGWKNKPLDKLPFLYELNSRFTKEGEPRASFILGSCYISANKK